MKTIEQLMIILLSNDNLTKSHLVSLASIDCFWSTRRKTGWEGWGGGGGEDRVKLIVVMENFKLFCMNVII